MTSGEDILILKHGALGDIILATAAFKAIRAKHPAARITLLTTKPFVELLAKSPYFNEIWVDSKPKWHQRKTLCRLRSMLNSKRWAFVYDLQCSGRTSLYPWLFHRPWPKISTYNRWVSHPRKTYDTGVHALTNLRRQLALANIEVGAIPDLGWLQENINGLLAAIGASPFALLVPGGAAHRPEKRWPAEHYASLAQELAGRGLTPVLIGTNAEKEVLESIAARVPKVVNLGGKTTIGQLASLARAAKIAVGNDTGPMHVIGAAGCPSVVLFSHASDPVRSAPVGEAITVLRERALAELSVDRVLGSIGALAIPENLG